MTNSSSLSSSQSLALLFAIEVDACHIAGTTGTNDNLYVITCEGCFRYPAGRAHAVVQRHERAWEQTPTSSTAAAFVAGCAHEEAASVYAFEALYAELDALAAPAQLLVELERAAEDERRHARALGAWATDRGVPPRWPSRGSVPTRGLLELALENEVEGCVRETWAALVAGYQASHAGDPQLRDAMAEIAADETRHAELAWRIRAWLVAQLDEPSKHSLAQARAQAIASLAEQLHPIEDEDTTRTLGLPDASQARALFEGLSSQLWALRC